MKTHRFFLRAPLAVALSAALLFTALPASAHCDGRDGPVVAAARQALETGDVARVLIWVQKDQESELRHAFQKARAVRGLDPAARELADDYFFETVVRIHRAGEGEPYTGLKPAGRDLGPAIPAADKALASGSVAPVINLLTQDVRHDVEEKFKRANLAKNFKPGDVAAGQEYVKAYVSYVHTVERIHEATAAKDAHGAKPVAEAHGAKPVAAAHGH